MVAAQGANLSAELFRQAVEARSCGMVLIDGAGKIFMMVNTQTERLFGYPREELIGRLPRDNQGETAASIRMRMRRGWTDGARA